MNKLSGSIEFEVALNSPLVNGQIEDMFNINIYGKKYGCQIYKKILSENHMTIEGQLFAFNQPPIKLD